MMNTFTHVPPGFRFHPTDEELVDYYLRRKVTSGRIDLDVIKDVDLYKIEPWDLQELCRIGTEEQNEWYFFSHKDKKYPTGTRTNRATAAGFWKATGRDKAIYSKHDLIGMRKTLVFYKGRAPNGQKSDWIMHEYRLESDANGTPQEEGWVVCKVFKKRLASTINKESSEHDSPIWYDDQVSLIPEMDSPKQQPSHQSGLTYGRHPLPCKKEPDSQYHPVQPANPQFLHLPLLDSPKLLPTAPPPAVTSSSIFAYGSVLQEHAYPYSRDPTTRLVYENQHSTNQVTDWRVLDRFVASQLSHEEVAEENSFQHQEIAPENASPASSSSMIDLWK